MRMGRKNLIVRSLCFIVAYLLFYFVPILVIQVAPLSAMKRLPAWVGNYCFIIPAWTFPFDKMSWENHGEDYIFSESTGWFIMVVYLVLLCFLFSKLTRPVQRLRWIVLLTFCFSALSIFLLNSVLMACGITVYVNAP